MIWLANPRDFVGLELDVIAHGSGRGIDLWRTWHGSRHLDGRVHAGDGQKLNTDHHEGGHHWQRVVVGLIIIVATAITAWRDRKSIA